MWPWGEQPARPIKNARSQADFVLFKSGAPRGYNSDAEGILFPEKDRFILWLLVTSHATVSYH
jgi:hypothetical protein